MKKIILSVFFMVFVVSFSNAQGMKEWTWDTYKMKFQAPNNLKVTTNNADEFTASNSDISLSIYPRKGENLSYEGMELALMKWAKSSKLDYENDPEYIEDLNGYWGVYIDGEAEGYPATMLLLVDPDYPEISLYVWISYSTAKYDTAVNILKSFSLN